MSSVPTLYQSIKDLGVCPKAPEFIKAATAVIKHVVGAENAYDCQKQLKEAVDFSQTKTSAQKFRLMLADISYVHLNVKFFCLNLLKRGMSRKNLWLFKEDFGIDRNDVVLIRKALGQRGLRSQLKSSGPVKAIRKDQITKAAFDDVYKPFNAIYPDLLKHIKSRTYTKLRFISVSSNMEFYDFHMELMCKVLQAYIRMVPTDKEPLHIANYLRRTISNHTSNLIKAYTTQKRQRMVKGKADGFGSNHFEIPVVSENQLFRAFGLENLSYESMQSSDHQYDEEKAKEAQLNFDMVLKRFGKTPKRRVFIRLIAQSESPKFTDFLLRSGLISDGQDNVDYSEIAGREAYFEAVCDYCRVSTRKARRFLLRIAEVAYPEVLAAENPYGAYGT